MTEPHRPIAEEDLHALVDGFLDEERRETVEGYLESHPADARRVAGYTALRQELRSALSARATEPIPPKLNLARLVEARLMRRRSPWPTAAAAMLALGLGAAGGWLVGTRPAGGIDALAREAVASYTIYAFDTHRPVEISAEQRNDLARWISLRLNRPMAPPELATVGYHLLGGRLVPSLEGAAALFLYENGQGARLAVYVRPMSTRRTTPIETIDVGAVDGCAWIEQGVGYSLIAAESYKRLVELSQYVRQELRLRS